MSNGILFIEYFVNKHWKFFKSEIYLSSGGSYGGVESNFFRKDKSYPCDGSGILSSAGNYGGVESKIFKLTIFISQVAIIVGKFLFLVTLLVLVVLPPFQSTNVKTKGG